MELILQAASLMYRGTSLTRKRTPLGPYSRTMPRVLGGSWGGGRFLMNEVPLYLSTRVNVCRAPLTPYSERAPFTGVPRS